MAMFGGGILDGLLGTDGQGLLGGSQSGGGLMDALQSPQMAMAAQLMAAPRNDAKGFPISGARQIGSALGGFQQEMRQRRLDKMQEKQLELGMSNLVPSNIREWNQFQAMSPEQQRAYLTMKRATQMMDLGDRILPYDPLGGMPPAQPIGGASNAAPQPIQPPAPQGVMSPNDAAMMQELYPDGLMTPAQPVELTGAGSTGNGILSQPAAQQPSSGGFMKQPPPQDMPEFKSEQEREKAKGKAMGEAEVLLADMTSNMPHLNNVVGKLDKLADAAAYTAVDSFDASLKRQLGVDVGSPAEAKAEYISRVDNEILPLLRQTFGAAFTAAEGDSLRATLGDPDISPPEKKAKLRAFIDAKVGQIQSLQRRTGQAVTPSSEISTYGQQPAPIDDLKSKYGLE